jgi:hypothetical protein
MFLFLFPIMLRIKKIFMLLVFSSISSLSQPLIIFLIVKWFFYEKFDVLDTSIMVLTFESAFYFFLVFISEISTVFWF